MNLNFMAEYYMNDHIIIVIITPLIKIISHINLRLHLINILSNKLNNQSRVIISTFAAINSQKLFCQIN